MNNKREYTIDSLLEIIKKRTPNRYNHVYGTYQTATTLAKHYQVELLPTQIAAILHDYAKQVDYDAMRTIIEEQLHDKVLLSHSVKVYHGPVGAYLVNKDLGIDDKKVLDAIKYHVTGYSKMSDIGKIVFISDYIEPNRTHPAVEFCRRMAMQSLDLGVLACIEDTMDYLNEMKERDIHPWTKEAYRYYLNRIGEETYGIIKSRSRCD